MNRLGEDVKLDQGVQQELNKLRNEVKHLSDSLDSEKTARRIADQDTKKEIGAKDGMIAKMTRQIQDLENKVQLLQQPHSIHISDEIHSVRESPGIISEPFENYDPNTLQLINEPLPKNSSNDVVFDIVEYGVIGNLQKKLLIFTSNERNQCYEYLPCTRTSKEYQCSKHPESIIIATIHDDGSKTFNFETIKEHVCQPIQYLPENYYKSLIVKSPNFKLFNRKSNRGWNPSLFIKVSDAGNFFYKFGFEKQSKQYYCYGCKLLKKLTARFIQLNGCNAIELGHSHHRCKPENM
uniref:Uncharacterized protein n=1 Tax=Panagrolaimus sp. ES5 TaxID=591445 RepID=A0AC34FRR9_9BILA